MTASIGWLLLFLVPKLHYVPWDGIMIFWRKIWSAVSSIFFSLYLNSCFAHCWVLFGIEIKFHLKENTYTKAYTYIAHWIRSMVFSDIFIWYVWFHYTIQASIYVWLLVYWKDFKNWIKTPFAAHLGIRQMRNLVA